MAELMFFERKEDNIFSANWQREYENITTANGRYESTSVAQSDGKFSSAQIPKIIITPIKNSSLVSYKDFIADHFVVQRAKDDLGMPYYTEAKFEFFKNNDLIGSFETKNKGRHQKMMSGYLLDKYYYDARHFDKIEITFTEANAGQKGIITAFAVDMLYPKILNDKELTINDFSSFKIKEAINVLSDDMPMGSLECDIVSTSEFNIKKSTLFDVENNGKYYGRFVVVDFKRTGENVYHLSANSLKELLEREEYSDWLSHSGRDPLKVMSDKTSVALGITFKDVYDYKEYGGYIDVGTCRHALCQFAWAQNVMASDARKSYIEFIPVPKTVKHKITNSGGKKKIIGNATLSETPQFSNARYTVYDYDFFESGEVVEIGRVTGILTTNQTYYFEKPPVIIDFDASGLNDYVGSRPKYNVIDYSSSKIHFLQTAEFGDTPAIEKTFMGYQSTRREFPIMVYRDSAYVDSSISGTKEYDKYTLHAMKENMPDVGDKTKMIKEVLESRGEVKAKIVLEDEQVGDLVDIDTAFEGTIRGIITSMEYTPNFQTIADITIQALDIGLEPLYDENGNPIYDKLDDIILVEGDA